jgi:hypothetical protein
MSALPLLAELADAGITLVRDGDNLRIRADKTIDLSAFAPRIRQHKPALHEALLQKEIITLAHGPTDSFDRARFDVLFGEWKAQYAFSWDQKEGLPCLIVSPQPVRLHTSRGSAPS